MSINTYGQYHKIKIKILGQLNIWLILLESDLRTLFSSCTPLFICALDCINKKKIKINKNVQKKKKDVQKSFSFLKPIIVDHKSPLSFNGANLVVL